MKTFISVVVLSIFAIFLVAGAIAGINYAYESYQRGQAQEEREAKEAARSPAERAQFDAQLAAEARKIRSDAEDANLAAYKAKKNAEAAAELKAYQDQQQAKQPTVIIVAPAGPTEAQQWEDDAAKQQARDKFTRDQLNRRFLGGQGR
jgi:hypothetical protein